MMDVRRSQPAPQDLLESSEVYRTAGVLAALYCDFFGKCYLCERVVMEECFEVDHRHPWRGAEPEEMKRALRQAWSNLFPACRDCNGARSNSWPPKGLLDSSGGDQVEQRLIQELERSSQPPRYIPKFSERDPEDAEARNTAKELNCIHLGLNWDGQRKASQGKTRARLAEIHDQVTLVADHALRYHQLHARGDRGSPDLVLLEFELRELLGRRAPFTMLIRSRYQDDPLIAPLFAESEEERRARMRSFVTCSGEARTEAERTSRSQ